MAANDTIRGRLRGARIRHIRGNAVDAGLEAALDADFSLAVEELKAFCRIQSVSTDPTYRHGIAAAAAWVAAAARGAPVSGTVETVADGRPPRSSIAELVRGRRAPRPSLSTATTTCSRPTPLERWT